MILLWLSCQSVRRERIKLETKEDGNFNTIDLFKLLMAVAVVAIHTNPIVNWTNQTAIRIVVMIEGWAVPFFFTASGFFLFYTMKEPYTKEIKRIDRYLFKIIKMYCAWTLISFPLTLYGYFISENGIISCVLSYVKYFLFVGKLYNSYHLWYLLSLIYALIAIRFMVKKKIKPVTIAIIAAGVHLFSECMLVLMENPDMTGKAVRKFVSFYQYVFNNGGIFSGMVYVSAGMLIAALRLRINKWIGITAIVMLMVAKLFFEAGTVYGVVVRLLMPFEAALLFMTLLDIRLPNHEIWEKCRKISTVIYLSHLIFFSIYTFLIIKNPNKLGLDSFLVTLILSLVNAVFLTTVQKRGHFKLLKHII